MTFGFIYTVESTLSLKMHMSTLIGFLKVESIRWNCFENSDDACFDLYLQEK